jgi:alanyl-tRNA synthetase
MLSRIELLVNRLILASGKVECDEMPIEEARKMGAMMLFGEKYPEEVRVVRTLGESTELCGGTHVKNTSQISLFKIISEESISAGIRRITALTGEKAIEKVSHDSALLQSIATTLKIPAEKIPERVESLTEQIKQLQKQLKSAQSAGGVSAEELISKAETVVGRENIGTVTLITGILPHPDLNAARQLIDKIKQKVESAGVVLAFVESGKVTLLTGLSRDLTAKRLSAVQWIETIAPIIGGTRGGGRPDMAQSGGNDPAKLPEVFKEAGKFFA